MAEQLPLQTSVGDLCTAALVESGAFGQGQTPLAQDMTDALARLQWMLQQWERQRFLVYHLVTKMITSTGAQAYSIGPNGDINTMGDFSTDFGPDFQPPAVEGTAPDGLAPAAIVGNGLNPQTAPVGAGWPRPDKIEAAYLRQLTQSQPNQIDYPLEIIHSQEDYANIALKGLVSFPGCLFYDPAWPLGWIYPWPIPQANIYAIAVVIKEQLPSSFASIASIINLPLEYYEAILYNLAMRLRSKYGIRTRAGDPLPNLARDSQKVLRGANTAIARLRMPGDLNRPGIYNIFSDRFY